jgi:hypothetical protein
MNWFHNNITPASFSEAECLNTLTVLSSDVSLGNAISHSGDRILDGRIFTTTMPAMPDNTSVQHTGKATLYAIPLAGNKFTGWDDNNTDNPRVVDVTGDVTYTAVFAGCEECPDCPDPPKPTGVEVQSVSSFQVYPNPADNILQITLATSANGHLTLYDISGKAVLTQSVSGANAVMNIGSLAAGNYILRLVENGKAGAGVKIVKN